MGSATGASKTFQLESLINPVCIYETKKQFTENFKQQADKEKGLAWGAKPLFYMVGAKGFEPSTPSTPLRCATRLRYAPKRHAC